MLFTSKSLVLQLQNLKLQKHQFILSFFLPWWKLHDAFLSQKHFLTSRLFDSFCKLFCLTIKPKWFTEVKHLLSASPLIIVSFDEDYPHLSVSLLPFVCSSFSWTVHRVFVLTFCIKPSLKRQLLAETACFIGRLLRDRKWSRKRWCRNSLFPV